jgi:hypothetical protein
MSRLNILTLGTLGVDQKTNPLLLSASRKLHTATNLVFEEGVVRTRPGFRYVSLKASGQFQGACEFAPAKGQSSGTFSETGAGIAWTVDGVPMFTTLGDGCVCKTVPLSFDAPFRCKGEVHLYQAENYLILQNPETRTYWWNGSSEIVPSPGMAEQDWNDPEMPFLENDLTPSVADIPDCAPVVLPWGVRFTVIDAITKLAIPLPIWAFKLKTVLKFDGIGDLDGQFTLEPLAKRYHYTISKTGYYPKTDVAVTFQAPTNEDTHNPCRVIIEGARIVDYVVELTPVSITPPETCPVPGI